MSERNRLVEVIEAFRDEHYLTFLAFLVFLLGSQALYNYRVSTRLDKAEEIAKIEACGCQVTNTTFEKR